MLGSRSGFIVRIEQRSPNAVGTHCVIHRQFLVLRTSPATINDKLAIAIRVVNFIETGSIKSMLFISLCKDMDADHETLLFHTAV